MKYKKAHSLVVALAAMGFVTASVAADPSAVLQQVDGRVLVGQNNATVPGQEGMKLFEGARVIAVDGASAKLVYTDGCTVSLPQNSMMTIAGAGQCSAGLAMAAKTEGLNGQPVGQTRRRQAGFWGPQHIVGIPLTFLVGGGIGAWINNDSGNNNNSSQQAALAAAAAANREEQARQAALLNAQIAAANADATNAAAAAAAEQARLRAQIAADQAQISALRKAVSQ